MSALGVKPSPSGVTYIIPAAIWALFSIAAVVIGIQQGAQYGSIIDDFARIESGRTETVELSSTGGYRVWLERPGVDSETLRPPTTVTVMRGGDEIAVEPYDSTTDLQYSSGSRDGIAVQTFNISEPGRYEITATADDGQPATFAIGRGNPLTQAGKGVAWFFGIGTLGFLIALVVFIVIAVKRGRSKRQIRQASFGGGFGGGGFGAPGPPAYGAPGGYGSAAPGGYGPPPSPGAYAPPPPFGSPPPPPG